MESFILFYEKCRLCLDRPGVQDIFQAKELPQDILLCIGVKVKRSDNLPQKICSKCLNIINNTKELRNLATKNDTHLRSLFNGGSPDSNENLYLEDDEDSDRLVIAESSTETTPKTTPNKKTQASPKKCEVIKVRKDLFDSQTAAATSSIRAPADSVSSVNSKPSQSSPNAKRIRREHNNGEELRCEVCDKTFDKWKKLYLHRRFHNKKISCPLDGCGKKFATKGDLERHLRIHTGVKPYQCNVCTQSFTQNSTLKSHMKALHRELVECDV